MVSAQLEPLLMRRSSDSVIEKGQKRLDSVAYPASRSCVSGYKRRQPGVALV